MSTTMSRQGAEFWWNLPLKGIERKPFVVPKDVAYYTKDDPYGWQSVTWDAIHKRRTKEINSIVRYKRRHPVIKPCFVWVFCTGSRLMGGNYTMIKTLRIEYYLNFRGVGISNNTSENKLRLKVMNLFPLCSPVLELFDSWMDLFMKQYKNTTFFNGRIKKQGLTKANCLIDKCGHLENIMSL